MKKLSLIFMMLLLPVIGFADDYGTCGDDMTWKFIKETGTLTITGTGSIPNYNIGDFAPWNDVRSDIKNIVMDTGVTSIGSYAFFNCSNMISITIPNSVTSIGSYAFRYCI